MGVKNEEACKPGSMEEVWIVSGVAQAEVTGCLFLSEVWMNIVCGKVAEQMQR